MNASAGSGRATRRSAAWRAMRCVAAGFAALVLGSAAQAQAQPEVSLARSDALACLSPPEGERVRPVYPAEELKLKERMTVRAELAFDAPDRRPTVDFLDANDGAAFEAAVREYARQLRVPCMKPGAPAVHLRQDFVFEPNDGRKVVWTAASDQADARRRALLKCVVRPQGQEAAVEYPPKDLRALKQGIVVVRALFTDPARAPEISVLDNGGSGGFALAVQPYLEKMRMPCLQQEPLALHMFFHFRIDGVGGSRHVLKDMDLASFLAVAAQVPTAYFDTNTMGCPFDVRLKFRQPFEANGISELETDVPARHALLDWLAGLKVNLDAKSAKELFSQESTIHVPCVKLDL